MHPSTKRHSIPSYLYISLCLHVGVVISLTWAFYLIHEIFSKNMQKVQNFQIIKLNGDKVTQLIKLIFTTFVPLIVILKRIKTFIQDSASTFSVIFHIPCALNTMGFSVHSTKGYKCFKMVPCAKASLAFHLEHSK